MTNFIMREEKKEAVSVGNALKNSNATVALSYIAVKTAKMTIEQAMAEAVFIYQIA
jgi:hypothetical protein